MPYATPRILGFGGAPINWMRRGACRVAVCFSFLRLTQKRVSSAARVDMEATLATFMTKETAFVNINPSELKIVAHARPKGGNVPAFFDAQQDKAVLGLAHLAPPAVVSYAHCKPSGNFQKELFGGVFVTEPEKAVYEISVNCLPLDEASEANELMLRYVDWLEDLRTALLSHVIANPSDYPEVTRSLSHMTEDIKAAVLETNTSHIPSYKRNPERQIIPNSGSATFKQNVFYRPFEGSKVPTNFFSEEDEEIYKTMGLVRRYLSVFHAVSGTRVRADEVGIYKGSQVGVEASVRPLIIGNKLAFQRQLRSITIFKDAPTLSPRAPRASPFQ